MIRLGWRVLPMAILLYTLQGTAHQYAKYFTMAKQASNYAMTYMNITQYVVALQSYYVENKDFPPDLSAFLRSRFTAKGHDPSLDYWDKPYTLTQSGDRFTLMSCGADRTCLTEDDLSKSASKGDPSLPATGG